jgi:hypothetical protein
LKAEVAPNINSQPYWLATCIIYGIILIGILVAMFMILCGDFDPLNDFEKRRKKQNKDTGKVKDTAKIAKKMSSTKNLG